MESFLLDALDRVHTTPMGMERIRKNLSLEAGVDPVGWCKEKILAADAITREGKNFYARWNDVVITVNAYSFTIITAHRKKIDGKN